MRAKTCPDRKSRVPPLSLNEPFSHFDGRVIGSAGGRSPASSYRTCHSLGK